MDANQHQLEPAFDFSGKKKSVLLNKNLAEVCINGNIYAGVGEVRLDLLPRARIYIYGYFKCVSPKDAMETSIGQSEISSFSINGYQVEGFRVGGGGDLDSQDFNIKWCPKSEPILGIGEESTQLARVVFHLFNFVDIHGDRRTTERSDTAIHAIQHVDLSGDKWKVEIKSLISTQKNIKYLREEGGYRLTHIGDIRKDADTPFSGKDAQEILIALRFFLSFIRGGWCEPICAVGFDASNSRVWEMWSSPREPWHSPQSWFDPHNNSQLTSLFPVFMQRWVNEDWREALHEVVYWYLNANYSSRGIDAGIILTQAAIERLSFEFAVKEKRLVTMEGFKNLWASDKFRLLFSSLGIPLEIPDEAHELQKLACKGQMNWLDAPHALTEIRNSLVHPEHKRRGQLSSVYYEAWNLGLWCLEMCLLAICGYSGTYGNRLKQRWIGQVENVPWI